MVAEPAALLARVYRRYPNTVYYLVNQLRRVDLLEPAAEEASPDTLLHHAILTLLPDCERARAQSLFALESRLSGLRRLSPPVGAAAGGRMKLHPEALGFDAPPEIVSALEVIRQHRRASVRVRLSFLLAGTEIEPLYLRFEPGASTAQPHLAWLEDTLNVLPLNPRRQALLSTLSDAAPRAAEDAAWLEWLARRGVLVRC